MSDRYFVDTNILMYAHDTTAGAKHERAKAVVEELWRDRSGVVSTQVLQELTVNLRRKAAARVAPGSGTRRTPMWPRSVEKVVALARIPTKGWVDSQNMRLSQPLHLASKRFPRRG